MNGVRVAHVVVTDEFAGVERYLTYVAPALARLGAEVVVVGGDPVRMADVLGSTGVQHIPAPRVADAIAALRRLRPTLIHTHMTAAEAAAVASVQRVPIVSTRHFASKRGSSLLGRGAAPVLRKR